MEIEKTLTVAAPVEQVWAMLLDPQVMGACVPGMQSIEVLSEDEYVALMQVKISFISARFKLRTRIVERRAPHYLRTTGTGEDAAVASSLKQQSEIFLEALPDGQTTLRMKVQVDVMGRLGTFGLSVMKTKADRMWEEFAGHLATRLAPSASAVPATGDALPADESPTVPPTEVSVAAPAPSAPAASTPQPAQQRMAPVSAAPPPTRSPTWWERLTGRAPSVPATIHVEIVRGDTTIRVDWPAQDAAACAAWLLQAQSGR